MGSRTFDEMDRMFEQMDRMFEQMRGRWHDGRWQNGGRVPAIAGESEHPSRTLDVAVDLHEADDGYTLYVDLPGFERDEIDLRVDDGVLVLKASHEVENSGGFRSRRVFERLSLPEGVDADSIDASYQNGVLEIDLPLAEDVETGTRIDID